MLHVSVRTIRELIKKGEIPHLRVGTRIRIHEDEVHEALRYRPSGALHLESDADTAATSAVST